MAPHRHPVFIGAVKEGERAVGRLAKPQKRTPKKLMVVEDLPP
jgi:hypothetical protein